MKKSRIISVLLLALLLTFEGRAQVNDECKAFLARKPTEQSKPEEVIKTASGLVHSVWTDDLGTARKILDHAVTLLQTAEEPERQVDTLYSHIGVKHKETVNSVVLLNRGAARHHSSTGAGYSNAAIRAHYSKFRDDALKEYNVQGRHFYGCPRYEDAVLAGIQRLDKIVPPDELFPVYFIFYERYEMNRKRYTKALAWMKENQKRSLFVKQCLHLLNLGLRWNEKQYEFPDDAIEYFRTTFSNREYAVEHRFAFYDKLSDAMGIPVPEEFADLIVPIAEDVVQRKTFGLRYLINTPKYLVRAKVDDRWKRVAGKVVELSAGNESFLDRYWDESIQVLLKLGRDEEALKRLQGEQRRSQARSYVIPLDAGHTQWCAENLPTFVKHGKYVQTKSDAALTPARRKAADRVIAAIDDPGMKIYAALFYASLQSAQADANGRPKGMTASPQHEELLKSLEQLHEQLPELSTDILLKCHTHFLVPKRRDRKARDLISKIEIEMAEALWRRGRKDEARKIAEQLMKVGATADIKERAHDLAKFGRVRLLPQTLAKDRFQLLEMMPDGTSILAATAKGEVHLLDCANRKVLFTRKLKAPAGALAISKDGMLWAAGDGGKVFLFHREKTKEAPSVFEGHEKKVSALAFSANRKLLLSASLDGTIRVWDVQTVKAKYVIKAPRGLRCAVFFPGSKRVAAAAFDRNIYVWQLGKEQPIQTLKGHKFSVRDLDVSTDGKRLLSGSDDMSIRLWDVAQEKTIAAFKEHTSLVTGVCFYGNDAKFLSSSLDGTVRNWDVLTGKEIGKGVLSEDGITTLAIAPDEKTLYATGRTARILAVPMKMVDHDE